MVAHGLPPEALIVVDRHDLIVGATRASRLALRLPPGPIARALPVADVLAGPGREDLSEAERGVLERALARTGGNVSAAARSLGISRATLYRKLARHGAAAG